VSAEVTFIIVNYNTKELLRECVDSILQDGIEQVEIIVVDNASTDGSAELIRRCFPTVRLCANAENIGFPKAVNQGLRLGSGDYFFILNSDVRLLKGTTPILLRYMEENLQVGIAAPVHLTPEGVPLLTVHHDPTLWREIARNLLLTDIWRYRILGRILARQCRAPAAVDWVTGAALFVRREMVETVGGMDEKVFMYGEEYDWAFRARKAGWEVHIVPQARVIHHQGASANATFSARRYSLVTRSTYYFYLKHHGRRGFRLLLLAHIWGSFLRMLLVSPLVLLGRPWARHQWQEHLHVIRLSWAPEYWRGGNV